MTKKKKIVKDLIWVYPPNNWKSSSHKTFVYGSTNLGARLFVSTDEYLTPERINIFPNGNFAKVINLPNIENDVRLIQILGKKKTILKRKISVGADQCVCPNDGSDQKIRLKGEHIGSPQHKTRRFVIVIDPGHGGKEHGTHSPKGIPEKYFNLQIAKMTVRALRAAFGPLRGRSEASEPRLRRATSLPGEIYLTRTKDKFVSLKDRVNFAKKKKCNLLISIHHNALPDGEDPLKHRGVGIYYTHDFVRPLAKRFLDSISKSVGARHGMPLLKKYGIFKRNFFVTKPGFYRGILIECGFLIHPVEGEYITKREIQEKIVRGIVKGIFMF